MFLLHIWRFSCFTLGLQKDAVKEGGEGSVQKHTGAYRRGACNGVWVHTQFDYLSSVIFFSLGSMQMLQTLRVNIYTNRFQELYHCYIRLQVFITLYKSSLGLWESLSFMQPQVMAVLALNSRFLLDFNSSRIGVQFRNKLTLCKVNIGL